MEISSILLIAFLKQMKSLGIKVALVTQEFYLGPLLKPIQVFLDRIPSLMHGHPTHSLVSSVDLQTEVHSISLLLSLMKILRNTGPLIDSERHYSSLISILTLIHWPPLCGYDLAIRSYSIKSRPLPANSLLAKSISFQWREKSGGGPCQGSYWSPLRWQQWIFLIHWCS